MLGNGNLALLFLREHVFQDLWRLKYLEWNEIPRRPDVEKFLVYKTFFIRNKNVKIKCCWSLRLQGVECIPIFSIFYFKIHRYFVLCILLNLFSVFFSFKNKVAVSPGGLTLTRRICHPADEHSVFQFFRWLGSLPTGLCLIATGLNAWQWDEIADRVMAHHGWTSTYATLMTPQLCFVWVLSSPVT